MDEQRYYRVPFRGVPAWPNQEIGEIHLSWKMLSIDFTSGAAEPVYGWSIYPVTIVQARYQGSYEGGRWLCFPVPAHVLDNEFWLGWQDSDIECMGWWSRANTEKWPIGRAGTPNDAYLDLIEQVKKMAGIEEPKLYGRRANGIIGYKEMTAEEIAALPEAERAEWFYAYREQVMKESEDNNG